MIHLRSFSFEHSFPLLKTGARGIFLASCCFFLIGRFAYAESPQRPKLYAIVVANNLSLDNELEPLRFADDDGAKYFELFKAAGATTTLLAVLDPDAQRRYPEAARAAAAPTKKELLAAVESFFEQIEGDARTGTETNFFFVYSGHGGVGANQEGYLNLLDAKFKRSELYSEILARSPATFNHIILDACHAYFVVEKRGGRPDKQGDYSAAVRDFLNRENLSSYPNTGVILAASSEAETHEWGRFEAGIFSHELRSAVLGAADVDADGKVTYSEAAACVEAANSAVDVPQAKLKVFFRPPAINVDAPILDLESFVLFARVELEKKMADRYHIEDARGVRVADFNFSAEQPVTLYLIGQAPFFLRTEQKEAVIEEDSNEVVASDLEFKPRAAAAKGSVEMSFRRNLYKTPFGMGFYQGVVAAGERDESVFERSELPQVESRAEVGRRSGLFKLGAITLGAGVATGAAAGFVYYAANQSYDDYKKADTPDDIQDYKEESQTRLNASRVLLGVGSGLAVTGVTLLIVDAVRGKKKKTTASFSPIVADAEGGVIIGVTAKW